MQISHIINHANVFDYFQKPEISEKFLLMSAFLFLLYILLHKDTFD